MWPLVIPIIKAVGSVAGGLLSNKSKQSTTPTLDPAFSGLQNTILQAIQKRLGAPSALPTGYEANGIGDINSTYDLIRRQRENALTSRGLAGSPVAANADLIAGNARAGDIGQFRAGLPGLERQFGNQDLGLAEQLLQMGRGSTTTSSSGGGAAGAATSLAQLLGYLHATGQLGKGAGTPGASPSSLLGNSMIGSVG